MINISRLYCGVGSRSDSLRYGEGGGLRSAAERRPVVVWNITRTCNLRCLHCYSDSEVRRYPGELTGEEARAVLQDLLVFDVPAVLLSGGEPLTRPDLFELAQYAKSLGLRLTLSTNGTLITEGIAAEIKEAGFTYVGISLDGMGEVNDRFRGVTGAFARTVRGFRHLKAVGQRVGLRMTLTRHTVADLPRIFDFIEREEIDRACFYHLVPSGRARNLLLEQPPLLPRSIYHVVPSPQGRRAPGEDLSPEESRRALDIILARTEDLHKRGKAVEILTVDNHVDGVYLYLTLRERDPERAEHVHRLLAWNGGGMYSSGVGIGCIDFQGNVHPDQFWMHYTLGNVRERSFSEIWQDTTDPILQGLRNRRAYIAGRCAGCQWFDLCGGSLRVRADLVTGDPWAPDPACYLTNEEIGREMAPVVGAPPREGDVR